MKNLNSDKTMNKNAFFILLCQPYYGFYLNNRQIKSRKIKQRNENEEIYYEETFFYLV